MCPHVIIDIQPFLSWDVSGAKLLPFEYSVKNCTWLKLLFAASLYWSSKFHSLIFKKKNNGKLLTLSTDWRCLMTGHYLEDGKKWHFCSFKKSQICFFFFFKQADNSVSIVPWSTIFQIVSQKTWRNDGFIVCKNWPNLRTEEWGEQRVIIPESRFWSGRKSLTNLWSLAIQLLVVTPTSHPPSPHLQVQPPRATNLQLCASSSLLSAGLQSSIQKRKEILSCPNPHAPETTYILTFIHIYKYIYI